MPAMFVWEMATLNVQVTNTALHTKRASKAHALRWQYMEVYSIHGHETFLRGIQNKLDPELVGQGSRQAEFQYAFGWILLLDNPRL